jgi:hypothetical protein
MIDNQNLKDQQDITNAFNNNFSSVLDKINKGNGNNILNNEKVSSFHHYLERDYDYSPPSLVIKTLSTEEITSIIKVLKTKNSYGYDEISKKPLKISALYMCSPLTYICNKSILPGTFPDRLKFSIIKPIFKKGNKMNLTNDRPVSLLTSFSKGFEKALFNRLTAHFNRLTAHFNTNKLLVGNQFGFWKSIATEDAIFKLINGTLNALNNNNKNAW